MFLGLPLISLIIETSQTKSMRTIGFPPQCEQDRSGVILHRAYSDLFKLSRLWKSSSQISGKIKAEESVFGASFII